MEAVSILLDAIPLPDAPAGVSVNVLEEVNVVTRRCAQQNDEPKKNDQEILS